LDIILRNHIVETIIQVLAYRELGIQLAESDRLEFTAVPVLALFNTAEAELAWIDSQVTQDLLEHEPDVWAYQAMMSQLYWWSKQLLRTLPGFRPAPVESRRMAVVMRRLDELTSTI
jgi:hypothetical protein